MYGERPNTRENQSCYSRSISNHVYQVVILLCKYVISCWEFFIYIYIYRGEYQILLSKYLHVGFIVSILSKKNRKPDVGMSGLPLRNLLRSCVPRACSVRQYNGVTGAAPGVKDKNDHPRVLITGWSVSV